MSTSNLDIGLRIRDAIVAGDLQFGARITIDALATRYGVSHMLVEAVAGVIGVLLIWELVGRLAAGNGRRRAAVMFRGRQFRNRG